MQHTTHPALPLIPRISRERVDFLRIPSAVHLTTISSSSWKTSSSPRRGCLSVTYFHVTSCHPTVGPPTCTPRSASPSWQGRTTEGTSPSARFLSCSLSFSFFCLFFFHSSLRHSIDARFFMKRHICRMLHFFFFSTSSTVCSSRLSRPCPPINVSPSFVPSLFRILCEGGN